MDLFLSLLFSPICFATHDSYSAELAISEISGHVLLWESKAQKTSLVAFQNGDFHFFPYVLNSTLWNALTHPLFSSSLAYLCVRYVGECKLILVRHALPWRMISCPRLTSTLCIPLHNQNWQKTNGSLKWGTKSKRSSLPHKLNQNLWKERDQIRPEQANPSLIIRMSWCVFWHKC